VFLISLAYNQVIELFPNAAAATRSRRGSSGRTPARRGAALIVDYVLTIAISVASGVDAIFSFLPPASRL